MKNSFHLIISFLIIIFVSFQATDAQVSRNPEPGRPISRIPRPGNQDNISDRDRGNTVEKTKERKNPPPQTTPPVNNPVSKSPVEKPEHPVISPAHQYHPKPQHNCPIDGPTVIDTPPEIIIVESPDKYIDDNPLSEIEGNESAIKRYDEALKSNPDDTLLFYLRGNAKLVTGDYYGAVEDFTVYLKLVPWDKEAYFKRGLAFLYYGDQKDALLDFKIASELGYTKGDSIIKKYY